MSINKSKDSLNLCEMPISCFNKFIPLVDPEINNIIPIVATDPKTKKRLSGYIKITVPTDDDNYIYPSLGSSEEDMIIALMKLSYEQGFRNRKVTFRSIREIGDTLGWSHGGATQARIMESLYKLKAVLIETDLFWDREKGMYCKVVMNILDEISFDNMDKNGTLISNKKLGGHFIWNETLFKSFDEGYLKNLDIGIYKSIKSAAARKLFRVLDKRFYKYAIVWLPLEHIAVNILRIDNKGNWYYKRIMDKYLNELKEIGFLEDYWYAKKFNQEHLFCKRAPNNRELTSLFDEKIDIKNVETSDVFDSLLRLIGDPQVVKNLVATRENSFIAKWMDCIDRGMASSKEITNPAGYLIKALDKEWPLPAPYLEQIEKEATHKIQLSVKQTAIDNCSYCDDHGKRVHKYKNMAGREVTSIIECNHFKDPFIN